MLWELWDEYSKRNRKVEGDEEDGIEGSMNYPSAGHMQ